MTRVVLAPIICSKARPGCPGRCAQSLARRRDAVEPGKRAPDYQANAAGPGAVCRFGHKSEAFTGVFM